ncbi:cAMP-mediated signaling protein sok1 [Coemansia aciculifera]|nr:cAMP-mediated signaling protein sok1 [Coemansia aciculifera]
MSESYTTQDSDYLSAAHHTQPTSAAGRGDSPGSAAAAAAVATHDFLSSALSTSRDSSNDGPSAPVSNSGNVAVASRADLINASVGSMSPPTMAPSVVSDASCAGATSPTSAAPSSLGQTQMVSFQHQAMAGSSAMAAAATTVSNGAQRSVGLCEPGSVALTHSVHAVCRGTKRRGSDSSIVLMAVGSGDSNEHSQSAYSAQTSGTIAACTTRQRSTITAGTAAANAASASVSAPALVATSASRAHRQTELQPRHQQQHQQLAPKPSAPATVPVVAKTQVCTLPPINRYTLRELKIQNILQNPRLRHEVLFEPKLEFRPNLVGHLAEAKQRAAVQYWTAVDHGLRKNNSAAVSTLTMLLVELREILAEMAEDSPRAELSCHATELRERLDEERLRQQIAHGVFDAEPVVRYLASVMRLFAQAAAAQRESGVVHDAAINRVLAYVQRGRVVRALRAAFDVMEAIKIDTANGSIEMYREYMRSTAVSFERSHFNLALQRSSLSLSDTTEWWRRVLEGGCGSGDVTPSSATATFAATSGASLDIVFAEAARELILDEGQSIPGLFRMDEGRIQGIRREAERLAIVGMVFLAFSQFLQLVASRSAAGGAAVAPVVGEFKNANGRVEYERLAAECLLIVPEGCAVKWTELLIAAPATTKSATAAAPNAMDGGVLPGEVGFSHLVSELVLLAERVLGRIVTCAEVAMLERTLLRTARYECPLREVVEERVNGAVRLHTAALTELSGKVAGTECEAMPQAAKDMLRRSMLLFLAPSLSTLSMRIHAVVSHHWMVYKALYASILSSTMPLSAATTTATTTSNPPSPPLQPFPSLSPL